ncbi:MAG: hypothetical protein WD404_02480 [Solirubrobacterales bacterium]
MITEPQNEERPLADEGSWVYLIGAGNRREDAGELRERVIDACEASGWPAVSWSPDTKGAEKEPGRLFEGMRHAVAHSDFVVALLGAPAGTVDAELAIAYGHRRPIVGIHRSAEGMAISKTQAMLEDYEVARLIRCEDLEGCAAQLRGVLSDPDFTAAIHASAGENEKHG